MFLVACSSSSKGTAPGALDDGDAGSLCGEHASLLDDFHATASWTGDAGYKAELLDAVPPAPSFSAPGGNVWKVKVMDPSGAALGDGAVVTVRCSMPGHNHDCSGEGATVTSLGGGTFEISKMVYQMHGFWIINLHVADPRVKDGGADADVIPIEICVP